MARNKKENNLVKIDENENIIDIEKLKEELRDYVTLEVKKEFNSEVEKANKRLIKEKNKSIIWKNIIILILICFICFLLYLMYHDKYFERLFNKETERVEEVGTKENTLNDNNIEKESNEKKYTLDELKNNYAYLLDNIYINEESKYLNDYYKGNLTNELKNYLAFNLVDFKLLSKDDDYNVIDDDTIRIKYNKLFNDNYISESFDYNGNEIRYINRINSYISNSLLEKIGTNIKKDIVNITVDDKKIIIETKEYLLKDNETYNVLTKEKINELENSGLIYVVYTFENEGLISLKMK